MTDLLTNRSLFWRFILPCFVPDVRKWQRTSPASNPAATVVRWIAFFTVLLTTLYSGVFILMYKPTLLPNFSYLYNEAIPIIISDIQSEMIIWYALQYFVIVNLTNAAALHILNPSPLAYRVATSILAEKTLPNGWRRIEQIDEKTVDVLIGVTLAKFRACEDELQAIGGLDILNIEEVKHGHIRITCRIAQAVNHERPYHMRGHSIVFDDPRTVYWYVMHDGNGRVKVGHSFDPRKLRLPALSGGNPDLKFYRREDGEDFIFPQTAQYNEKRFKEQFADLRIEKEFFNLTPELRTFLETYEMN